jgi:hypothetical protein
MAVDFYEANLSSNNNNLMFNIGCFQPESPTNLSPSQAPSSQRPHLRLYERQQTTTTTPQSPLDSAFGCWSPISQNEEEPIKWSNGDLLWKNSSSCEVVIFNYGSYRLIVKMRPFFIDSSLVKLPFQI